MPNPTLSLEAALDIDEFASNPIASVRSSDSTLGGAVWLVGSNVVRLAISFALIPILSRLLAPQEYGQFNLIFPLIIALMILSDLGFGPALVRLRGSSEVSESTVLFVSLLVSLAMVGVLVIASEPIARSIGHPEVAYLLRESSIVFVLGALCSVPFARLQREGWLRGFALGDLTGAVIGGVGAIIAAWYGAGVQSLLVQQILSMGARLVVAVAYSDFKPVPRIDLAFLRYNIAFALYSMGSNFASFLARSLDVVIIGIVIGTYGLGIYSMGMQIVRLPEAVVAGPIYAALLPAFSKCAERPETFIEIYRSALFLVLVFCSSCLVGISAVSHEIVDALLGEKWVDVAQVITVLTICAFATCVSIVQQAALLGTGRAKTQFAIMSFGSVLTLSTVLVATQWGLLETAIGVSTAVVVTSLVMIGAVCRAERLPIAALLSDAASPILSAVAMTVGVVVARPLIAVEGPFVKMVAMVAVGAAIFVTVFLCLGGRRRLFLALNQISAK